MSVPAVAKTVAIEGPQTTGAECSTSAAIYKRFQIVENALINSRDILTESYRLCLMSWLDSARTIMQQGFEEKRYCGGKRGTCTRDDGPKSKPNFLVERLLGYERRANAAVDSRAVHAAMLVHIRETTKAVLLTTGHATVRRADGRLLHEVASGVRDMPIQPKEPKRLDRDTMAALRVRGEAPRACPRGIRTWQPT